MYNLSEKALIWLSAFDLSVPKEEKLLALVGGTKNLLNNFSGSNQVRSLLGEELYREMLEDLDDAFINAYIKGLDSMGIVCLTIESEDYPEELKNIYEPPYVLFCKGDLNLLKTKRLAIVGTRKPTNYGKLMTEKFAKELAKSGLTIVSGLAYGVDTISHRGALDVNGKTIAVLGGGFNHIYPASNNGLYEEIVDKGLIISEYKPSTKPTKYSFPQRNRIIAGISEGVFITEASENSGSLHTKNFALDFGKDVFALPGNVNSPASSGTNRILKNAEAHFICEPKDILDLMNIIVNKEEKINAIQYTLDEQFVINALNEGEKDVAFLAEKTGLSINILNSCLTTLEIRGIIKRLPGNVFSLN